ncbi:MAG: DUF5331 domain-containing protein [Sphaerospermopsis sp. SIO1G2]|nr:DUF5331 domain-containing protein [Sphaerospermopsis sp. SIO1G2]
MAFFDSFTDSIKQKWLQFFQANRDWIILQMTIESVYTPDGGKRPSSYLILGVVNALEPKLAQLMFPFAKLNPDADTLVEVLGLHFDPDITLGNRLSPLQEPEIYADDSSEEIEEISDLQPVEHNDFDIQAEPTMNEFQMDDLENENAFDSISLSDDSMKEDFQPPSDLDSVEDFGEMSFESADLSEDSNDSGLSDFNLTDDSGFGNLNQPDDNEFRDVISDVWGDETSQKIGEENNNLLGEELPSEVFDESEMARLFPNN